VPTTTLKFRSYLEPVMAQLKGCLVVAAELAAPWRWVVRGAAASG
jgi:hypothetical protein